MRLLPIINLLTNITRRALVFAFLLNGPAIVSAQSSIKPAPTEPASIEAEATNPAGGSNPTDANRPKKTEAERKAAATVALKSVALKPEQEQAALDFARAHHPELLGLLERLKSQHPAEYRNGLAEVHRAAERVKRIAEKFPEKAEFELSDWKFTSRIRLLAARLKMGSDDPTLEPELRGLLLQRHENRLAALRSERDKSQKKMETLQLTIDDQSARAAEIIEKELKALRQSPPKSAGSEKPAKPKEI